MDSVKTAAREASSLTVEIPLEEIALGHQGNRRAINKILRALKEIDAANREAGQSTRHEETCRKLFNRAEAARKKGEKMLKQLKKMGAISSNFSVCEEGGEEILSKDGMTVFSLPSPYLPISDNEAVDETYKNVAKFLSDDRDFTEETWEDMEQEEFIQEFLGQMKRKYQGYDLSLFKLNLDDVCVIHNIVVAYVETTLMPNWQKVFFNVQKKALYSMAHAAGLAGEKFGHFFLPMISQENEGYWEKIKAAVIEKLVIAVAGKWEKYKTITMGGQSLKR